MNIRFFSSFVALLLALTAASAPAARARKPAAPAPAPVAAAAPDPAAVALDGPDEPVAPAALPVSVPLSYAQLGRAAEARGEMSQALGYYIRALPSAPDDITVIMGAARGALATGDADAATNFFSRALTLQPTNGMARAGVARALVLAQRPKEALRQFDLAERYGIEPAGYASDRGLAHDLRGEQRRAQQDYRLALTTHPRDPQTLQRYALSLAIQGDRNSARRMLDPLMAGGGNGATRRTLAFIDALTGDSASAVRLAGGAVGANQAAAMAPFFSRLPLLSASERAYAVHFGILPPTASGMATAQAKSVPLRVTRSTIDPATARSLAAGDTPPASRPGSLSSAEIAAIAASLQGGGIVNARPPALRTDCVMAPSKPAPKGKAAKPVAVDGCVEPPAKPLVEDCAPAKPATATKKRSKTKIRPKAEPCAVEQPAEPVDCLSAKAKGKRKAAKPEPCIDAAAKKQVEAKEDCSPAKPVKGAKGKAGKAKAAACPATPVPTPAKTKAKLPERFWVQVASGANKDDLPKAWSKLKSGTGGKALGSRTPYVASAGRSNRVLVGPFTEKEAAQDYLNTLTKAGLGGFTWTSPAGADVPKLPLK